MKLIKTASGKKTIKISKSEWQSIGKKAGWMKVSARPLSDYPGAGDVGGYPGIPYSEIEGGVDKEVVLVSPNNRLLLKITENGDNRSYEEMEVSVSDSFENDGKFIAETDWKEAASKYKWDDTLYNPHSSRYQPLPKSDPRHGLERRDFSDIDSIIRALEGKGWRVLVLDDTGYGVYGELKEYVEF